jgi:hypothetical protein
MPNQRSGIQKIYRFITIKQLIDVDASGKFVFEIINNPTTHVLGEITWFDPWGKYVFTPGDACIFDAKCLHNILDFIENVIPSI